jgi:hypothetical protein
MARMKKATAAAITITKLKLENIPSAIFIF